jgi:hypothetical protein
MRARESSGGALAALGGDIIVSGGLIDGKVVTWSAANGEWLGEAATGIRGLGDLGGV